QGETGHKMKERAHNRAPLICKIKKCGAKYLMHRCNLNTNARMRGAVLPVSATGRSLDVDRVT
ncbi:MAG: hypothetical protein AAFO86_02840, partial [Pseudomonadota bacterium]